MFEAGLEVQPSFMYTVRKTGEILNSLKVLITLAAVVMGVVAGVGLQAQQSSEETFKKYVMCRNGKTVRTIRVGADPADPESCVTTYTKGGKDEIVGSGKNPVSCVGVLERVQKTLEVNFWKCKDVQNTVMHRSAASVAPSAEKKTQTP